ncbi:zinc-binding dehydrogenase [Roseivivax sediminis]|uniref:Zinc-binding dehydrogenase n=1 Tax=Roseivivax sediminis TaxID=936889 RepID=A0A1I1SXR3_9RHOB|nr:zinc-binding dehydrogenase [Roseivivax sediminis]SFD51152.1 Zinc-binding dehydrogenase [Roseivivax sediminis]
MPLRAVPETLTWPEPDRIHFTPAAAVPISFGTAHHFPFARGRLQPDEVVLVQGAPEAWVLATIQLAMHAGAKVIGFASEACRVARLTELGADHVIDHRNAEVARAVLDLTRMLARISWSIPWDRLCRRRLERLYPKFERSL